ncbi:MAG: TolC family protein [Tannerellaceae bacterium]|jgi:outer membrane protein|nr:TolC family protein [Tannerellaceae bacterium]
MKRIYLYVALFLEMTFAGNAQERCWTMEECMRYAVDNSPAVKRQVYTADTYRAEYISSVASFFPSLETRTTAQYNYGRAIDPETNTYVNTTTFNNYYEGYTSIPVFNGGQLINQWRLAKSNRQMGMNDVQKEKDDLALNVLVAYVDVAYYQGTVRFAAEKQEESNRILYKTKREEELGVKGRADVAQIEAQAAGDEYNLTRQQNLLNTALLKLKELMNFPYDRVLAIDTTALVTDYFFGDESSGDIFSSARENNPAVLQAGFQLQASRLNLLIQKGKLFPSISFSAGINTSYFKNLKSETSPVAFRDQFRNNRGEYINFNIRFPLFDGLTRITDVRRARNNVRIAQEQQTEVVRQLQTAIEQSILDRRGYARESIQMEKKLKSDELAYQVTLRKFEEGIMSPIDLQTSANTLIESKANLLQRKLMYLLKCKEVDYYKGKPLIIDNSPTVNH